MVLESGWVGTERLYCSDECKNRAARVRRTENDYGRDNELKKYGITENDYNEMFASQGGCCAICGKHQQDESRRLAVDHNHSTGEVRGLLCCGCNTFLGRLECNAGLVDRCRDYLNRADEVSSDV